MAPENNRPSDPRDRDQMRESGPMGDSRERGKSAADPQRKPSLPEQNEQNRKLGKRHD